MERRLRGYCSTRATGLGCPRATAGLGASPVPGAGLKPDVLIGDWHKPWNNKKATSHAGAPGTPYWATDAAGFGQVGCVYTAQGFEYDWSGVIIGPDLVWRSDHWGPNPNAATTARSSVAPPRSSIRPSATHTRCC